MDPNAAFDSILHGHMISEHANALRERLWNGVFSPESRYIPVDCHEVFTPFTPKEVVATRQGIESLHDELLVSRRELEALEDSEY